MSQQPLLTQPQKAAAQVGRADPGGSQEEWFNFANHLQDALESLTLALQQKSASTLNADNYNFMKQALARFESAFDDAILEREKYRLSAIRHNAEVAKGGPSGK